MAPRLLGRDRELARAGHRVAFATAAECVARLAQAHHTGRLQDEITKLGRIPLLIVDLCRDRNYAESSVLDRVRAAW